MVEHAARPQNSDLLRRIGVTLAALAVYRLGCAIPLPGVDVSVLGAHAASAGMTMSMERVSVMALGLLPLLSALLLLETAMLAWPPLRAWASQPENSAHFNAVAASAALLLSCFQSFGFAGALQDFGGSLVVNPGFEFRTGVIATQIGATAVLLWLASVISRHGIGSGAWVLIAAPYAISMADVLRLQAITLGTVSPALWSAIGFLALAVAVMVTLLKASPPVTEPDEFVWVPLLGFTLSHWLISLAWIGGWLLLPPQQVPDYDTMTGPFGSLLLPLAGIALVAVLRRRGGAHAMPSNAGHALLLTGTLGGLAVLGTLFERLAPQPMFFPGTVSVLLLAATGVAVVNGLSAKYHPASSPA